MADSLSNITVLAVEDDPVQLEWLTFQLSQISLTPLPANNGEEALALFEHYHPPIVVTDIHMPKMNGNALARKIRSIAPDTVLIALSVHVEPETLLEAIESGFEHYMVKPVTQEQLNTIVISAARKACLNQELKQKQADLEEVYALAGICTFTCSNHDMEAPMQADHLLDHMFQIDHRRFTVSEFFHQHVRPDQPEPLLKRRARFLEEKRQPGVEKSFQMEIGMQKADGTPIEVLLKCRSRSDPQGKIHSRIVLKDLTDIKMHKTRLSRQAQELTMLLDSVPDGAWAWNMQEGYLYLSPRWKQMLGYEDHELKNHPDTFFLRLHPDDILVVQRAIERHLEGIDPFYEATFRLRCKDGHYKWIKARGKAMVGEDGKPVKLLGLHEDMDELIRLQEEQWKIAKELYEAQEIAKIGSFECDLQNPDTPLVATPEFFKVLGAEKLTDTNFSLTTLLNRFIYPDDLDTFLQVREEMLNKREKHWRHDLRIRRKDNKQVRFTTFFCRPTYDRSGTPTKGHGAIQDITERKQAEEALRQSEAKHRTLLDHLPLKVFYKDTNLNYLAVNQSYASDLHLTPEEIAGKNDFDLFPQELAEKYYADDARILEGCKLEEMDEHYMRNGSPIAIHTVKAPILDKEGKLLGVLGVFWDITERKQAEEKLRLSENTIRSLIDATDEAMFLLDVEGVVHYANVNTAQRMGKQVSDILGKSMMTLLAPALANARKAKAMEAMRTKHPIRFEDNWQGRTLDNNIYPIFNERGKVVQFAVVSHDITQRKAMEDRLRESEAKFRTIFDDAWEGILVADAETGTSLFANKRMATMLGYSEKELLKLDPTTLHPEGEQPWILKARQKHAQGLMSKVYALPMVRKDGIVFYADNTASLITLDGRKCVAGFFTDVTDRKKAEDAVKNLNQSLEKRVQEELQKNREKEALMIQQGRFAAMGEMLSMIAHQWRQPLNAVSATAIYIKLMSEMGELDEESVHQQCDIIENQTKQMSQTINDFMTFFKPDKEIAPFNLHACVEKVHTMMQAQLKTHAVELLIDVPETIELVGIKNEMEHILLNLIGNARDVIEERQPKEKRITVKATELSNQVRLSITDTGGGIPEAIVEKIFNPYFTTKSQNKGTGIGLYMAKIIIEQHFNGQIHLENTPEGADFIITLPRGAL